VSEEVRARGVLLNHCLDPELHLQAPQVPCIGACVCRRLFITTS
jgi:hypothetical protein